MYCAKLFICSQLPCELGAITLSILEITTCESERLFAWLPKQAILDFWPVESGFLHPYSCRHLARNPLKNSEPVIPECHSTFNFLHCSEKLGFESFKSYSLSLPHPPFFLQGSFLLSTAPWNMMLQKAVAPWGLVWSPLDHFGSTLCKHLARLVLSSVIAQQVSHQSASVVCSFLGQNLQEAKWTIFSPSLLKGWH